MHPRPLPTPRGPLIAQADPRPLARARSLAGVLAASVLIGLAGSACGGGASADAGSVPPAIESTAPADDATTTTEEATTAPEAPTSETVDVDGEAWFAGFHVTLGEATAELEPGRGGTVTIEAEFENTGDDDARLDATLDLAYGGEHAREASGMDIPSVPGGTTTNGTFAFDVEDTFSFDEAVLTFGRSANQQAVVPLSPAAGEAVTREPVELDLSGAGTAGDLRLELLEGELRADQPWKHGQMEDGSLVLTVRYDATFTSDFAGGFAFTAENVALRLPDGTVVGIIGDGQSQSIELIGPESTVKDLYSRFEIEDPASGEYALLVRSFDDAEAEIPFSIP
jgi:hypothetical protein